MTLTQTLKYPNCFILKKCSQFHHRAEKYIYNEIGTTLLRKIMSLQTNNFYEHIYCK